MEISLTQFLFYSHLMGLTVEHRGAQLPVTDYVVLEYWSFWRRRWNSQSINKDRAGLGIFITTKKVPFIKGTYKHETI